MNLKSVNNYFPAGKRWCTAVALACILQVASSPAGEIGNPAARSGPEWLRSGIVYEIFPRDFSAAGDLKGVTAQLDRLQALGVTILWTMPIHPIGQKFRKGEFGSPYSIRDFYAVDPHYGTVDDFKQLVTGAHQRGMKVIMDLVANHTSWDSVMMEHPDFYKHDAQGKMIPPVPEWTDVAAINYASPALRDYMIAMLQYWVKECDVDGFRCDSAGMVPTDFWEQGRQDLVRVKPDLMMLAEASKPELLTNAFDIDYSWPMLGTVKDVLSHGAPASTIRQSWEESRAQFPRDALHLRISDDHDEARAVSSYGVDGALAASALMFTLDGVPLIYNGMEVGDVVESDGDGLFGKQEIGWQPGKHPELNGVYHDLIQLRRQYPALRTLQTGWLHNSDEKHLVTFLRSDAKDDLLVAINFSRQPVTGQVNLKDTEGFVPVNVSGMGHSHEDSLPSLQLNGCEWRIYHRAAKPVLSGP